jgi:hypothetical protein
MTAQYQVPLERTANTPISEGVHLFTIKDFEEGESSNGNPMWTFTLACNTPTEEGKEVRMYLVLTPNARWKLENFLDAMRAPANGTVTADKFVGRQMRAQITHEMYEGRAQARVGEMFPVTQAASPVAKPAAPVPANVVKKTVPPAKKPAGLPADAKPEDEIPF